LNFMETPLHGAYIIELQLIRDSRGSFGRIFCLEELKTIGHDGQVVQMNHSITSAKGTIRGMHYQKPPWTEIKLVKCIRGAVFDVVIDIRKGSPTFLRWHGEVLSEKNMRMMYVPRGFAHGFQNLEEDSELLYLHTNYYHPEAEGAIRYDDPAVGIAWPLQVVVISERDRDYPILMEDFQGVIP
jgi:dTDP-4-dehydrorhamnose 3,5-epimerase